MLGIWCGLSFIAGGLVVGFWNSKIYPWFKGEATTVETKLKTGATSEIDKINTDIKSKI